MGKKIFPSTKNNNGCCSSKFVQGIEIQSSSLSQVPEFQQIVNNIQTQGDVTINIGDYIDELSVIILEILSDLLVDVNVAGTLNISNGSLVLVSNTISSNTNIIMNPTSNVIINGGLQVIGNTTNLETDFLTTKARVPIIAYNPNSIGSATSIDNLDRGISFDWPETFTTGIPVRKQSGFFGWNKENGRFVFWNRATTNISNHYQRSSITPFGVEIDEVYTNVIQSENITGSGNNSLLIRAGTLGTAALNVFAGTKTQTLINLDTRVSNNCLFLAENLESHSIGKLGSPGSGRFVVMDSNDTVERRITMEPTAGLEFLHTAKILLKTKLNSGAIFLESGDKVDIKSETNILLTTTSGQYFSDIATNNLTTTGNGFISFLSKQSSLSPPSTVNPSPSAGDFDVKAYTKITMEANGVITLRNNNTINIEANNFVKISPRLHVDEIRANTGTTVLFNSNLSMPSSFTLATDNIFNSSSSGILVQGGSNILNTNGKIILRAETSTTSSSTQTTNSGDILITSVNDTYIESVVGKINLLTNTLLADIEIKTFLADISLNAGKSLFQESTTNGISLIANSIHSLTSLPSGGILINAGYDNPVFTTANNLSLNSGNNILSTAKNDFIIQAEQGSGRIETLLSTKSLYLRSFNAGVYISSENTLPTLNSGAILIRTKNSSLPISSDDSINIIADKIVRLESETSTLSMASSTGSSLINSTSGTITIRNIGSGSSNNIHMICETGGFLFSSQTSLPVSGLGSFLFATKNVTIPGTVAADSFVFLADGNFTTRVKNNYVFESTSLGIILQTTASVAPPILSRKSIVLNSNVDPTSNFTGIGGSVSNIPSADGIIQLNPSLHTLINGKLRVGILESYDGNTSTPIVSNNGFNITGLTSWFVSTTKKIEFSAAGILPTFGSSTITSSGDNVAYFHGNVNMSGTIASNEILMKAVSSLNITPPNIPSGSGQGAIYIKHENYSTGTGLAGYTRPIFRDYHSSSPKSHYFALLSTTDGVAPSTTASGQIPYYNHSASQDFVLTAAPTTAGQVLTHQSGGTVIWAANNLQTVYDNSASTYSINLSQNAGVLNGISIRNNSSITSATENVFRISNSTGSSDYFSIKGQGDSINLLAGTISPILGTSEINLTSGTASTNGGNITATAGSSNTKNGRISIVSHRNGFTTPSQALSNGDIGLRSANNIILSSLLDTDIITSGITRITSKTKTYLFDTISSLGSISIAGKKIITERQAAIADPTTLTLVATVTSILNTMRIHGLIEP